MAEESEFFRAGVGAVIVNAEQKILALRRADVPSEAWQLPQGGVIKGEDPQSAVLREVREETGITETSLELVASSRQWLVYELPEPYRSGKVGRGQAQKWFLCKFEGQDSEIAPDGVEFDAWKWVSKEELLKDSVDFRRPVYAQLVAEFGDFLS